MKNPDFFKPLKINSYTLNDSGESVLILENIPVNKIDEFFLYLKNAAVSRTINLSGSENERDWYSIAENINLERRYIQDQDNYIQNIHFPLSSYRYFRIIIYNGKNDPLNIISAEKRIHPDSTSLPDIIQNPGPSFEQKDSSDHSTYITVLNPDLFHVSYISLRVNGPRFFKRQLEILSGQRQIGNFMISSDSMFHFQLPIINDSLFLIHIYNEDNAPLNITEIKTGQYAEKIITWLEPDKQYSIEMTNKNIPAPHYDLLNFRDSIPAFIPDCRISNVEPILTGGKIQDKSIFKQSWLWPVLIVVLLALVTFTLRLTKEMKNRP